MSDSPKSKNLTPHLVFAITAGAVGSAFQHGYNTGVVNAPQSLLEQFINVTYFNNYGVYAPVHTIKLLFSVIVSIYCLGGLAGALSSAFLAEKFGSRGALLLANVFVVVAAVLLGFSKQAGSYEMLIVGRFVIGINSGLNAALAPMYLTEISPVHLRGAVGTIYQLNITLSILVSQILGLPQILGTAELWPVLFGLTIAPTICMLCTLPACPESPKYLLLKKGEEEDAQKALRWLRGTDEIKKEMDIIRAEYEEMKSVPKVTLKEMWTKIFLRKPLIISVVIMLSQQLSGINAVIFYSTSIFKTAGLQEESAIHATLAMGTINVLMTVVSMLLVEKAGRKTLHMFGLGGMTIVTLILTISLAFIHQASFWTYISIACIIAFIIFFASGPGSIPWFLVTELFGQGARPIATSIAVGVNWFANFLVSVGFLPLEGLIGEYVFLIFTILLALFFVFTWIQVPETKGRNIEEIIAEFKKGIVTLVK